MKRTPLTRKVRLASRRGRIETRTRTKAERETKFQREYGSPERVEWIAQHGCLACGRTPSENAHTANGGMSRKGPPESIAPLCHTHHRELHRVGVRTFEARHAFMLSHLTLVQWAAWCERSWQRFTGQPAPVGSIVPRVLAELSGEDT
jgi:hypothetical protein